MNLTELKSELDADSLGRGYSGMTDAEAAADGHTKYRLRNRMSMSGSEILNAVDAGEWAALAVIDRQVVWDIVHLGTVNPYGVEQTLMVGVFGSGSATIIALAAARVELISRWTELDISGATAGDIQRARAL